MSAITEQNSETLHFQQSPPPLNLSYYENNEVFWPLTFLFLFKEILKPTISLNYLSKAINKYYSELNKKYNTNLSCSRKSILESLEKLNKLNYLTFESGSFLLTKSGYKIGQQSAQLFINQFKIAKNLN
ncbi:MAG: hypothetical protein ACW967_08220 [Candidatus Hodarchaeales archaeon]|jgi:hypothetical protein